MKSVLSIPLTIFLSLSFLAANGAIFDNYGIKFEYPVGYFVQTEEYKPDDFTWYIIKVFSNNTGNDVLFTITLMDSYLKLNPQTLQLEPVRAKQQYEDGIKVIEEHSDNKIVKVNETYKIGVAKINGYRIDAFSSDESHYGFGMYSQNPITNGTVQYDYWDKQENVPQSIREVEGILRTIEFIEISNNTSSIITDTQPVGFVKSSPLYGDIVTIPSSQSLTDGTIDNFLSKFFDNEVNSYDKGSSGDANSGGEKCPNGYHRSPDGDCERVTDTKGLSRCPNGYHRSPDGDCERVTD